MTKYTHGVTTQPIRKYDSPEQNNRVITFGGSVVEVERKEPTQGGGDPSFFVKIYKIPFESAIESGTWTSLDLLGQDFKDFIKDVPGLIIDTIDGVGTLTSGMVSTNDLAVYTDPETGNDYGTMLVEIGDLCTEIGDNAFQRPGDYESLLCAHFILPDTITRIGREAFEHMYQIMDINVPANLVQLGERAFAGCEILPQSFVEEMTDRFPETFSTSYTE